MFALNGGELWAYKVHSKCSKHQSDPMPAYYSGCLAQRDLLLAQRA